MAFLLLQIPCLLCVRQLWCIDIPTHNSDQNILVHAHLRLVLVLHLAQALQCKWIVEQPAGSEHVFSRHHRFEEYCNLKCFVTSLEQIVGMARKYDDSLNLNRW